MQRQKGRMESSSRLERGLLRRELLNCGLKDLMDLIKLKGAIFLVVRVETRACCVEGQV